MKTCSVENCERKHHTRGWCSMHASRMLRHGELGDASPTRTPIDRDKPCVVEECGRPVSSRGHCRAHAEQMREHGAVVKPRLKRRQTGFSDIDWFKDNIASDPSGCTLWLAGKTASGYGTMRVDGKLGYAHRFIYQHTHGALGKKDVIDHKCGNPSCVNIHHLQAVTQKQNNENRVARKDSSTGVRGVDMFGSELNPFRASLRHNKRVVHVGHFATLEEAEAAVVAARAKYFTNSLTDEGWRDEDVSA